MKKFVLFIGFLQILNLAVSVTVKPKNGVSVVPFERGDDFRITCEVENVPSGNDVVVVWKKDNVNIDEKSDKYDFETSNSNYSVVVKRAKDEDAGDYTCIATVNSQRNSTTILAASDIDVETQDNLNVVEGEKLRITCQAFGKPTPNITWIIGGVVYDKTNGSVELQADPEKKTPNAVLIMENVNMTDRGNYTCRGYSPILNKTVEDHTLVRIKDKYAALWPFLGICVEVFVLCAIILIYEKKRNKSELEESDTDQSPDQKNTPDHGKETNLRHRQ